MTQGIHCIGHLDNPVVEIVCKTHSSVGFLGFLHPSFSSGYPN